MYILQFANIITSLSVLLAPKYFVLLADGAEVNVYLRIVIVCRKGLREKADIICNDSWKLSYFFQVSGRPWASVADVKILLETIHFRGDR